MCDHVGDVAAGDMLADALRAPTATAVRRRVFRQLLSSLVYEGALATESDGTSHTVHGRDAQGRAVRYTFIATRAVGFDRVRLGPDPVRREVAGEVAEADSLARFLGEVRAAILPADGGVDDERLARFAREIEETRVKDTLAQHVRELRGDVLAGAEHDTLEGTVTDGHRYHPAYKSRIGFDLTDNARFGPEFLPAVRPLWLAAHRSIAEVTASATVSVTLALDELGPATAASFDDRVRAAGGEPAEYVWVPVHPWQWRERIPRTFADPIADGRLVRLGEDPRTFSALQSIRTLACRDDPERSQLKLALSITNTSTSRGLAPHTVRNAAPITDWLERLVAGDAYLRDEARVIVLGEILGAAVTPEPATDLVRADTEGVLAAIWRRSLPPFLDAGEAAVPVTGLTAAERDGTPLIDPWVRAQGIARWTERLVDAVALPLVHLLCRHGVALESHAQNMSLVHVDGRPVRVALKDFHDGVRFSRARLADPAGAPVLADPPAHHENRNSFVETDDPAQVTDFLLDAFFFVNLGELALLLAEHYGFEEAAFWGIAAARIRAHERRLGGPGIFDLFTPTLAVEQLTTRRLAPDTRLRLHTVPNPLHAADGRSQR